MAGKLLQVGDQWVRSDIVLYVRAEGDVVRIQCQHEGVRETVLVNYATNTAAREGASSFVVLVNAEVSA